MRLENTLLELYTKILSKYNKITKNLVETTSSEITFSHVNYLEIIASKEKIKPSELAKIMDVSKPAVTSITEVLMKKGYILKERCDNDKRVFYLSVTDKYKQNRFPISNLSSDFLERLYASFQNEDIQYLNHVIEKFIGIM